MNLILVKKGNSMGSKSLPKPHSVKLNFLMNVMLKMSAFVFPLITFPYVSRILGATGNGKIAFVSSVVAYFSMFAQLGIPTYGIRACAACRNNENRLNKTVQELLILNSVTVLISYIALIVCIQFIPRLQNEKTLFLVFSTTILLDSAGMSWLFQALEQYSYITIRNLGFKVLSIVLMFVFVQKPEDYVIYGAIYVVGTCGSSIINIIYASTFLEHRKVGKYNIKQHIKPILSFFMLSVSISVYTQMDSAMLGFMSSDAEVGYYAAATRMKVILVSAVTALGGVLLPRMSNYISQGKMKEFYMTIKKSFNFILVVSVAVTIFFSVMADATIRFLAGDGYIPAILPMKIISVTVILIGLSNITGMQILVPTNREKITTMSTVIGAIVNLIVNAMMIPRWGAIGAAIGTVLAEMTVLIVQIVNLRQELPDMIQGIQVARILVANSVSTIILVLLKNALSVKNYFWEICITAIVFFGVYGFMLLLLRENMMITYFNEYEKRIKLFLMKGNQNK